ncbi:hypothetical protein [Mycobacterium sp.]|uniref:hypothetical protein n=1 Tax=Mycobacterium sp. TaxID=1785 RepID=UPI002D943E74|nr:hypothetical protein [Mycobacterium sp.]
MTQTGMGSISSTSTSFGTVGWARQRGGRLTRGEKLREFASANRVLLHTAPAQVRMRLGLPNSNARSFDIDAILLPDSKIAREARTQLLTRWLMFTTLARRSPLEGRA